MPECVSYSATVAGHVILVVLVAKSYLIFGVPQARFPCTCGRLLHGILRRIHVQHNTRGCFRGPAAGSTHRRLFHRTAGRAHSEITGTANHKKENRPGA